MLNEQTKFYTPNDNRAGKPRYAPEVMKTNRPIIDALIDFGHLSGQAPAQVALGWLLAEKPWIVPIPGTTKLAHLQENFMLTHLQFSRRTTRSA